MTARFHWFAAAQPEDLTGLRLLMELTALRKLAGRGLSEQELALIRNLADATMRSAKRGDVPGYLQADVTLHLCLLELTGDPALSEIARLLLVPDPMHAPHAVESVDLMAREAREHRELVDMLADNRVSAADDLLRLHLSRLPTGRPAAARAARPVAGA
jgi:DNA-binding GntR family transcriptional regulator